MRYKFHTADVFTDRAFAGNSLAVIPDAAGLETDQMQRIAREFKLSETVFGFRAQDPANTLALRIFTPKLELPFAGHPTVGAAFVLAAIGAIELHGEHTSIVFEEKVGPVPVSIRASAGKPVFTQFAAPKMPAFGPAPPSPAALASMLSLEEADILTGEFSPQAVSCGVPFVFVPLQDRNAMNRVRVQYDRWQTLLARSWAPNLYLISFDTESAQAQVHARMFAPAVLSDEDPATGAAATALAGYLGVRDAARDATLHWVVEQGIEMGRPSVMEVEADKADCDIVAVRVGGASVLVSAGGIEVPDAQLCNR